MKIIKNASQMPKRYYGLHMCEGVAEYREPGKEPYRIMVPENAIKNMDPSFTGRPVYVQHVDEVNLANLQEECDGFVVRSFYNKADGKHWAEFIVTSDKGHEAISKGWKLSNAYLPKKMTDGGQWHGVDYDREVQVGEYEHLAIVPNPRYTESIILTPEEFKAYNQQKETEILRLANSKEENKIMSKFNFFKRTKVENAVELETTVVTLPKTGREVTIETLINEADEKEAKKDNAYVCNGSEIMNMDDEGDMSVNALKAKYNEMKKELNAMKKKNDEAEEKKPSDDKKKENEEDKDKDDKKKNADDSFESGIQNPAKGEDNFDKLKNAPETATPPETVKVVETSDDMVRRGQSRYGSGK